MSRLRIQPEWVAIEDLRRVGDAYEVLTEDGPVTRLPDSRPVIVLILPSGRRFWLPTVYGGGASEWDRAQRALATIQHKGSVNLDKWTWVHSVYGSPSYFRDGWHELDKRVGD